MTIIVDAQIHSGAPGRGRWTTVAADRRDAHFFPEESDLLVEMSKAGVGAVVLVPPLGWGERPDNRPWLDLAIAHPTKFCVMGRCLAEDQEWASRLGEWLAVPGMQGMRLSFHGRRGNQKLLRDGSLETFWTEADTLEMPVMVNAPGMADVLYQIAERHPGVRLIIDHLGVSAEERYDDLRPVVRPLLRLAGLSNVAVKASALPAVISEEYPYSRLQDCLKEVVGAFGANRVFWGSDLSRLPCEYGQLVRFFEEELDFLSDGERRQVLGEGIVRWLRWHALEESLAGSEETAS